MAKKVDKTLNTTKSINSSDLSEAKARQEIDKAKQILKNSKMVHVSIPKQLAPSLGSVVNLNINGVPCPVPVNGESYEIPEPYLPILKERLKTTQSADIEKETNIEIK